MRSGGSPEHRRQDSRCGEQEVGSGIESGQPGKTNEIQRDHGEDEGETPAKPQRSKVMRFNKFVVVVLGMTGMTVTSICIVLNQFIHFYIYCYDLLYY